MTQIISEQMRTLLNSLQELDTSKDHMLDTGLEGPLNPKQLADILGIDDLPVFTRSMNKIKTGKTDQLTRAEMTELAVAFVNLLAAEEKDTQKAMMALKRVSAKEEPVMEDAGKDHITMTYTPTLPLVRLLDYNTWELKNAPQEITDLLDKISGTLPPVISPDWKKNSRNPRNIAAKQFAMDLVKLGFRDNAKY